VPTDPPVMVAAGRFRDQLAKQDAAAMERLGQTYARIFARLQDKIDLLVLEIGVSSPNKQQVLDMARYKALMGQTADELQRFTAVLQEEVLRAADLNIPLGELHARQLVSSTVTGDFAIAGRFNVLPKDAIESILGFLSPDSPLFAKINELAPFTAQLVTDTIVDGVGLGYNPRKIAAMVSDAYGQGLTNALRTVRTVQLYSYREASRASMLANGEVVTGWYWGARLHGSTCMSCIAQHGTFHEMSERLNDHHNGRCAMIPGVKGFPPPITQTGEEWFKAQPEAAQRQQMGKGMHAAWKEGKFSLSDITGTREDAIYGEMRIAKPLKELVPKD